MDLRICVVASYFYPRGYGGNAVFELCSQLVKHGLEINVVTSRLKGLPNIQSLNGVNVYRIPTYFLKLFNTEYPFSPTAVTDILRIASHHSDLMHANFEIFQTTIASSIVKNFRKEPMVLTMHGQGRNSSASYGSMMLNLGYSINHNSLERISVRSADQIVALTGSVKKKALKLGADPEKISIIPNGVDTDCFRPFFPCQRYYDELKITKKQKVITFVGRLHPTNGIMLLLQAIPHVVKRHPNSIFILVGDGPLKSHVLGFLKFNDLEKNVRVLGYRNDISELLNLANVVVYPALSVGMPLSVMEAMACGKAVVAFDIEGNRELIANGKTGYFAEKINSDSLASCIIEALFDLNCLEILGNNARMFVEKYFKWELISKRVLSVYEKALSDR
jgi:glycosyltransferase involved in cell wall biosynthesis